MANESPIIKSEGTVLQTDNKVYLFKNDFNGQQISSRDAMSWLAEKQGRDLTKFEFGLLLSRPVNGSRDIMVIAALAPNGPSPLAVTRRIIGYLITTHPKAVNYQEIDTIQGFYDKDGNRYGELRTTVRQEPGLETPFVDPIDLVAGAVSGFVVGAVKTLLVESAEATSGLFRAAMTGVERKLLARGAAQEAATIREMTEEELSRVWGGAAG
jgi:hypothetical protein